METVSAIVILSVAVPPMLWAVTQAQRQRMNPVLASKARWLAVEKLEDIVADRHATPRGYTWLNAGNYPDENTGTITGYPAFSRTVTFPAETKADLTTTAPAPLGYQVVTVTVGWTNSDGDAASLAISTVLTDYDPDA
jgi:hypothetical protein